MRKSPRAEAGADGGAPGPASGLCPQPRPGRDHDTRRVAGRHSAPLRQTFTPGPGGRTEGRGTHRGEDVAAGTSRNP